MNGRFEPVVATGLPCASNPVFCAAASAAALGESGTSGCMTCAVGGGAAAGPGGSSSGPARPQAESASATAIEPAKAMVRRVSNKAAPIPFGHILSHQRRGDIVSARPCRRLRPWFRAV
jgi:hypothetical protein